MSDYPTGSTTKKDLGDGFIYVIRKTPVFKNGSSAWNGWKLKTTKDLYRDGKWVCDPLSIAEAKEIKNEYL